MSSSTAKGWLHSSQRVLSYNPLFSKNHNSVAMHGYSSLCMATSIINYFLIITFVHYSFINFIQVQFSSYLVANVN